MRIASHLDEDVLEPGQFRKMNVGLAMKLVSRATGAAIRVLVDKYGRPKSYLTTAIFCEQVGEWFDIMSSRTSSFCFHQNAPETNARRVDFLKNFMKFYSNMAF